MARHNNVGKWGEELACEKLRSDGFTVVDTNWRSGHNEIDIVAVKDNTIVFVEVKTRTDKDTDPFDAIDSKKIAHLSRAAHSYIRSNEIRQIPRFDIIGICGTPEDYSLEHIRDAFYPPLKTYR